MQHIQPLLPPQPCQSQAHRDNDRTVPNPCFTSPQTMHIRVRILNLFHRALLWHFIAYHRSEEHTSELQSQSNLVCRLLLEKKKKKKITKIQKQQYSK